MIVAALAPERRIWTAAGFGYAATAGLASILLRSDPAMGWTALMLVFLVVWVTDIGGYFAGRGIGGRKLWPRISPNKTWAGAVGGFAASLVVAAGFAALGLGKTGPMLLLGAVLSIVSQLGDLFESAVKRRFGVKDSSHIIPGPWRVIRSARWICRSRRAGGDFRAFARRRGWRWQRSYGLVKI